MIPGYIRAVSLAGACVLLWTFSSIAQAEQYQDQIDRFFPAFQILGPTEFWGFIQDKNLKRNPGLITGKFNNDDFEDVAALIRSKKPVKQDKWDRYAARVVVCHGAKGGGYQCIKLGEFSYSGTSRFYLKRRVPGRVGCWDDTDAIATTDIIEQVTDVAASAFFWQPDGTYRKCVTAD